LLPATYNAVQEKVTQILPKISYFCATTDCWTSRTTDSYMAVTCHFIDEDWKMSSVLLGCPQLEERHTAENLSAELLCIFNNFEIVDRIHVIVTDSAANMKAAVRLTTKNHVPCVSHVLNTVGTSE
jgi:hypothetical protein